MKKRSFDPGFEFMFSVGIMAALALPQLIFAQDKKDKVKEINITIKGNDTTFNGRNLKEMSAGEKQQALAEISKTVRPKGRMMHREMAMRGSTDSDRVRYYTFRTDSGIRFNSDKNDPRSFRFDIDMRREGPEGMNFNSRPMRIRTMERRNSQNFDYNYSDKSGINTHVSYRVAEPFADVSKKIAGVERSDLDLQDLTLTPQFSTGRTVLAFTLPGKGADVQFTDSDGKVIWREKAATSTFSKTFNLGMNGIYYLVVKQAGKAAVKHIIKE